MTRLPEKPLKPVWRTPISSGFSGPSVSENRVFVTDFVKNSGNVSNIASGREKVFGEERVHGLDLDTGKILWTHSYPVEYSVSYPGGPRTSPQVQGNKVYTIGTDGNLFCLSVDDGRVIWSKDFKKDYNAETPFWGHSAHPIVYDDMLICMVGAKDSIVVAFDLETGQERWKSLQAAEPGYAPPALASFDDKPTLLIWHPESLNGINPRDGSVYWSLPISARSGMSVTAPLVVGNNIYISGIGTPPTLISVAKDGKSASIVWTGHARKGVVSGNSSPVVYQNLLFGVDTQGKLIASSFETGEHLWSTFEATTGDRRQRYFTAFLVRHQSRFFIFNEQGELVLAELTEDGYSERGRSKILDATMGTYGRSVIWSHPAFSSKSIFVRNDKEIVRVSLAGDDN